ncbi:MAG: IS481 family transposase [Actinomycetota bacterium]
MNHFSTKLTPYLREKMISDHEGGETVTAIAKKFGISRKCFYYWQGRYKTSGREGLMNRSSRPHRSPSRIPFEAEEAILAARRKRRRCHQMIAHEMGLPPSTVYKVLLRNGENRLSVKERKPVLRYEKTYPGELVHIDIKHLPQINKDAKAYQFSAVDDFSREAFGMIFESKSTVSATRFLEEVKRRFPYEIKAVMTDNDLAFTMKYAYNKKGTTKFAKACKRSGIRHQTIRPRRPETNGKVERFHRTVDDELYDIIRFQGAKERVIALQCYLKRYNEKRIHLGIGGLTPIQRRDRYYATQKCYQCA